jgi:hypothetical protein
LGGLTGQRQSQIVGLLYCMYCMDRSISMYWFEFCIIYIYIYSMYNVCIACTDFDYMDCFLETIILIPHKNPETCTMHMSKDSKSICSHHNNSELCFQHITQPIRDGSSANGRILVTGTIRTRDTITYQYITMCTNINTQYGKA